MLNPTATRAKPNPRDIELLTMRTIASQFPVTFDNGAVWNKLTCACRGCGETLPDDQVRGAIIRRSEHMASIEASGVCYPCNLLTRYVYRLYDDRRITGPRNGQWQTWYAKPPSVFQRIRRSLGF